MKTDKISVLSLGEGKGILAIQENSKVIGASIVGLQLSRGSDAVRVQTHVLNIIPDFVLKKGAGLKTKIGDEDAICTADW